MTSEPIRAAVVGGGIGGLSAALLMLRQGIDVHVYEQAAALGEVGAGVQLTPNSIRLLERAGVGAELQNAGATLGPGSCYYRMDGSWVADMQISDTNGTGRLYGMHRADLLSILAGALPADRVHTGHRCTGVTQTETSATITFDDGRTASADVVIGADGINSVVRELVTTPSTPVHSGSVAYRGLLDVEDIPFWRTDISQLWMGEGKHFLVFPVRGGKMVNYVGFVPSSEETSESWSAPGDRDVLAAAFTGWDEPVERLLAAVRSCFWWGLYDREPIRTWTSGRVTLLGDAAHPMLPHLGQGANQAVEDGAALAILLAAAGRADIQRALSTYEDLRREHTAEVQLGARANGVRYDSGYDDLARRDAEIADMANFRRSLYDYDAEAAARAALERSPMSL